MTPGIAPTAAHHQAEVAAARVGIDVHHFSLAVAGIDSAAAKKVLAFG